MAQIAKPSVPLPICRFSGILQVDGYPGFERLGRRRHPARRVLGSCPLIEVLRHVDSDSGFGSNRNCFSAAASFADSLPFEAPNRTYVRFTRPSRRVGQGCATLKLTARTCSG
jgi:hypothetical protein